MNPTERIQRAVAEHYDVPRELMLSRRRTAALTTPRFVAMYLAKELTGATFVDLGGEFGRDWSSIRNGCDVVRRRVERDDQLRDDLAVLRGQLADLPAPAPRTREPEADDVPPTLSRLSIQILVCAASGIADDNAIAAKLGAGQSAVRGTIVALSRRGLMRRDGASKATRWPITDEGRAALDDWRRQHPPRSETEVLEREAEREAIVAAAVDRQLAAARWAAGEVRT